MEIHAQCLLWLSFTIALFYFISSRRPGRLPPGPRPLPIVGSMFALGSQPHRSLARLAKTYGPIMSLQLGRFTTVVVSTPDTARQVLHTHDHALSGRPHEDISRALRYNEAAIGWLPTNELWRTKRRICSTQLFTPKRMDDCKALRQQKMRQLVAYLRHFATAGEAVDIGRAVHTTALNLISSALFSLDMADFNSDSTQGFKEVVGAAMAEFGRPNISDVFPTLAAMDLQGNRSRLTAQFKKLHAVFDELIDKRLQLRSEKEKAPSDFLDSLIGSYVDDGGDSKLDRHAINTLLTDMFLAGIDTTTRSVEWAMTELLRHPGAMEKAHAELVNEVEESQVQQLPYLQAVVKESFRLHPTSPFLLPHLAEMDVELNGYVVPKGSHVLVNIWAIGRDEDVWVNPEVFMPERFLESQVDYKGRHFELIPFGAGRRMCPGLPLASRMVHLILGSMLHSFQWKLPEGMGPMDVGITEKFNPTLCKAVPLLAIPIIPT